MITVKSIFYAPAFVGAAIIGSRPGPNWRGLLFRIVGLAIVAAIFFGLLYVTFTAILPKADPRIAETMMTSALDKTLIAPGLFPRADTIVRAMLGAPVQTLLLLVGAGLAVVAGARGGKDRRTATALLLLAAPLASLAIYRNAFPYFFAFILPPAMPLVSYLWDRAGPRPLIANAIIATMTATGAIHYLGLLKQNKTTQDQTVAAVHALFPQPVAYIDRCSMIASFPKQGLFMSSWGMDDYRAKGHPIFAAILARKAPPLLIANSPALIGALTGVAPSNGKPLLPQDAAVLRENYVHHWGAIWVAGKVLEVTAKPEGFETPIAGPFTVGAVTAVQIDGKIREPGSVVMLGRGQHVAQSLQPTHLTLKWGNHLPMPRLKPATTPIFWGF